jgi:hypothetical protein
MVEEMKTEDWGLGWGGVGWKKPVGAKILSFLVGDLARERDR